MLAPFCEGESAPASVVERGAQALDWWARHVPGVARNGTLVVAPPRDAAEIERFAARTRSVGAGRRGARSARSSPTLAGASARGCSSPSEGHLDPREAMEALLQERLIGTRREMRFGVDVASRIALARGRRRRLPRLRRARRACRNFAACAARCCSCARARSRLSRPVRLLHPRIPLYVVPRADGVFMIGATMIESADKRRRHARARRSNC